jgi:hypothetical protein
MPSQHTDVNIPTQQLKFLLFAHTSIREISSVRRCLSLYLIKYASYTTVFLNRIADPMARARFSQVY